MSDISKINPNGTEYNLKDATARAGIESSKTIKSSVVTVNDAAPINAEDITVDITPVQDLHGYDRPWPGGAWKNKLQITATSGSTETMTYTVSGGKVTLNGSAPNGFTLLLAGASTLSSILNQSVILNGCPNLSGVRIQWWHYDGANTVRDTGSGTEAFTPTSTRGNIAIVIDSGVTLSNLTFYPMIRLATETDSTFAPYSNECPIEGWTGAELDRVGKNWFDKNANDTSKGYKDNTYLYYNHVEGSAEGWYISEYIRIPNIGSITLSGGRGNDPALCFYDVDKHYISGVAYSSIMPKTFSIPSNSAYIRLSVPKNLKDTLQLELGSTPTAYEPYQGQQYTANFGETVHGGKWYVTAGGADKTHGNIANYNGETINEPWLSSLDKYVAGATPTTGAQVVYPLTTPITISTPKRNVPMLKGINTVSANCGDTQLKYQPDNVIGELKGEIQKANSFVERMALREGSGAKDFSYGGWSFRLYIYRSMGQISMSVERISASNVIEQAVIKTFNGGSDYRAPEYLRPIFGLIQAATYTTPSGWAIQVHLTDEGYIMFEGMAPEVGASAPTSSNWNLVEPWATHQQAKDLFNN